MVRLGEAVTSLRFGVETGLMVGTHLDKEVELQTRRLHLVPDVRRLFHRRFILSHDQVACAAQKRVLLVGSGGGERARKGRT